MRVLLLVACVVALSRASHDSDRVHLELHGGVMSLDALGWREVGPVAAGHVHTVHVALRHRQQALQELAELVDRVSDPSSQHYGRYVSLHELSQMLQPPKQNTQAVLRWLKESLPSSSSSMVSISASTDFIRVKAPVSALQQLLHTPLAWYQSVVVPERRVVRAARPYTIPAALRDSIELITHLMELPSQRHLSPRGKNATHRRRSGDSLQGGNWKNDCAIDPVGFQCGGWITPGVLRSRYKVPYTSAATSTNNSVAVAEFEQEYYDESDLKTFSTTCGIKPAVAVSHVVGGNKPNDCKLGCSESLMDIQFLGAMTPGIPMTTFYHDDYSIFDWIVNVANTSNPPLVHSVSWGTDEISNSKSMMMRSNTEFQKLAARGITIFVASGDSGVWGRSGTQGNVFHPTFPASSPYVTAVGGTYFASNAIGTELGTSWSGGGFSDTFPMPSYQKSVVQSYLSAANLPPQSAWNRTGRAFPDIAALCGSKNPYCVLMSGEFQDLAGTSASCPVVAGIFGRLNGLRLAHGKPAFGLLNPLLYKWVSSSSPPFHDVTSGNNAGIGPYGFSATSGWDPVTGVGTPNFDLLSKLL